MHSQIFVVFIIGLVATHALPVPEETNSDVAVPIADIESPESLETKSVAQEEPVDLEPKADIQASESLKAKSVAQEEPDNLEPKAISSVDSSLEPIAEQVRAVISSVSDAINDMATEAKGAAVRTMDYAKELTAPMDGMERANGFRGMAERALDVYSKMQADAKNLLDRTLQNTDSVLSGRAALRNMAQALQNKYFTSDGQELVRGVMSFGHM